MYSCQAKGAGVLARPQGRTEYIRRVPVVVNARAVRPQQVVIAQTSKHTRTRARTHTHTYPHAHAHADIRELQAAALVLHADEPVARAFLLTRLPAAPSATRSATPSVGFLPAHSMGARRRTFTLETGARVAAHMLVTVGLVVRLGFVRAAGAAAGAALPDDLAGLLIDRLTLLPLRCR